MKELELLNQDKLQVSDEKPVEKKEVLIHTFRPQPGQKCWQYNFKTGKVTEAEYQMQNISYIRAGEKNGVHRKIKMNTDCIYEVAINKENAIRKFRKKISNIVTNTSRKIF